MERSFSMTLSKVLQHLCTDFPLGLPLHNLHYDTGRFLNKYIPSSIRKQPSDMDLFSNGIFTTFAVSTPPLVSFPSLLKDGNNN